MIKELLSIPIYYKTRISQTIFKELQKHATNHLGVKDIYALKDKFEGERYYKQFLSRSFAEIAFQNYTGIHFFDMIEKQQKDFRPLFIWGGKTVQLVDCSLDEYPKVPKVTYDSLVVCFVNLDSRDVWIVGQMSRELAMKESNIDLLSPLFRNTSYGVLTNLSVLSPL